MTFWYFLRQIGIDTLLYFLFTSLQNGQISFFFEKYTENLLKFCLKTCFCSELHSFELSGRKSDMSNVFRPNIWLIAWKCKENLLFSIQFGFSSPIFAKPDFFCLLQIYVEKSNIFRHFWDQPCYIGLLFRANPLFISDLRSGSWKE